MITIIKYLKRTLTSLSLDFSSSVICCCISSLLSHASLSTIACVGSEGSWVGLCESCVGAGSGGSWVGLFESCVGAGSGGSWVGFSRLIVDRLLSFFLPDS